MPDVIIPVEGYPSLGQLMPMATAQELLELSDPQQDALRLTAIAAVEEYCQQRFDAHEETKVIDGQGANTLYLPERLALIDSITINGLLWSDPVISERRDRLHFTDDWGWGYYEQAMAEVSRERFPRGFGNVEITGTWGWIAELFPQPVAIAILYDMEDTARADSNALSPTITAYRKLGIRGIDQGNLSVDIRGVPGLSPRVTALLDPYVWQGKLGALA